MRMQPLHRDRHGLGNEAAMLLLPFVVAIAIGLAILWPIAADILRAMGEADATAWQAVTTVVRERWFVAVTGSVLVALPSAILLAIPVVLWKERRQERARSSKTTGA